MLLGETRKSMCHDCEIRGADARRTRAAVFHSLSRGARRHCGARSSRRVNWSGGAHRGVREPALILGNDVVVTLWLVTRTGSPRVFDAEGLPGPYPLCLSDARDRRITCDSGMSNDDARFIHDCLRRARVLVERGGASAPQQSRHPPPGWRESGHNRSAQHPLLHSEQGTSVSDRGRLVQTSLRHLPWQNPGRIWVRDLRGGPRLPAGVPQNIISKRGTPYFHQGVSVSQSVPSAITFGESCNNEKHRSPPGVTGQWRGRGAGMAQAWRRLWAFFLAWVARAWRGHGAGVARA
eukprot:gene12967-biopygen21528